MQKKIITCLNCKTSMEVANPESKAFVVKQCPKCGLKLGVKFDNSETVIAESKPKKEIGYLMYGRDRYELKLGINTIGRKSDKKKATIQIATDDTSVSRIHAEIEVIKLENGCIKAILRDARVSENMDKDRLEGIKKHPMSYCGEEMYLEDRIDLENGDTFKIGGLTIKYLQ